jgi:hypothetical protein
MQGCPVWLGIRPLPCEGTNDKVEIVKAFLLSQIIPERFSVLITSEAVREVIQSQVVLIPKSLEYTPALIGGLRFRQLLFGLRRLRLLRIGRQDYTCNVAFGTRI